MTTPPRTLVLLALACACVSTPEPSPAPQDGISHTDMHAILEREDSRTDDGRLAELLASGSPETRERAARASRRITEDEPTGATSAALDDPDRRVRIEAAVAWDSIPIRPLVELLCPYGRGAEEALRAMRELEGTPEVEVAWRALFSLQRKARTALAEFDPDAPAPNPAPYGNNFAGPAYVAWSKSLDARARIFAVRGLGAAYPDRGTAATKLGTSRRPVLDALHAATLDPDWRVVCEAVLGLGALRFAESVPVIAKLAEHPSVHVRVCVYESFAQFTDSRDQLATAFDRAHADRSANVQAAAIVSSVKLHGDAYAPDLELKCMKRDPIIRVAVAEAAQQLSSPLAVPLLTRLANDPDLRVAGTALTALGDHLSPSVRQTLYRSLEHEDNGLRLAALGALANEPTADDVAHIARSLGTANDDEIANELRMNAMRAVREIESDAATRLLLEGAHSAHAYVRKVARECLAGRGVLVEPRAEDGSGRPTGELPEELIDLALATENPFVEIVTTRGTLLFELFPRETPFHVFNFMTLAEEDHYDGLLFHRVVPDFVIQGGCYRGDGNGNRSWRGGSLRSELTTRKYVRGSLGMPRTEDPDSGGSQFFVTHRPTPHLDGRYTIFGELREGFEVLDAVEVGDRILDVRRVE